MFAVRRLIELLRFLVVFVNYSAMNSTPILGRVPITSLSSVANNSNTRNLDNEIRLPSSNDALLNRVLQRRALILGTPRGSTEQVTTLLSPATRRALRILARNKYVVPSVY